MMRSFTVFHVLEGVTIFLLLSLAHGFTPSIRPRQFPACSHGTLKAKASDSNSIEERLVRRRSFLHLPIQLFILGQPLASRAAGGGNAKITPEEAEVRFREGYKAINYLIDHYDEICEGGGDNVRRYLGTIIGNPPSALVGIGKVMKALEDRADDFIEFTETSEEVIKSINQADGSAYMSIFVSTSTSYTPPKKYFDDAKIEVLRCKKAMNELATMVDIKL